MDATKRKLTVLDQIESADKVRRKIVDTASILYAKKGFSATSIEEISEAAGVSLPVTYHYVKKKAEIMRLIMEDVLNIFRESLTREIQDIHDPEEKLVIAVIIYFRVLDLHKEKALLIYQKSSSLDKVSKGRIMQLEEDVIRIFGEIIEEGVKKGVFRDVDVDLTAYNILIMAHMWVLKNWHFRKRLSLDKYIDRQLSNVLSLLRK
jgi:TetR/AcrR family transcriptional regulator, cholesterol catabolism regulator